MNSYSYAGDGLSTTQPEIQNFLFLMVLCLLLFWVWRMLRKLVILLELRNAIRSNQIVSLDAADLHNPSSNIQTHVAQVVRNIRARIPPLCAPRLLSIANLDRDSLKVTMHNDLLGLSFRFEARVPCSLEVFFGLKVSAWEKYQQVLGEEGDRLLRHHLEALGAKKEMEKGSAIEMQPVVGRHADLELGRLLSEGGPLLQPSFQSRDFHSCLGPEHFPPGAHEASFPCTVKTRSLQSLLSQRGSHPVIPAAIVFGRDVQAEFSVDGDNAMSSIVADAGVEVYILALDATSEGNMVPSVLKWIICPRFGVQEVLDIYGFERPSNTDNEEHVCTICLTEPPSITLLNCRHHCVCEECFQHVDKCPVCRADIHAHLSNKKMHGSAPPTEVRGVSSSSVSNALPQ